MKTSHMKRTLWVLEFLKCASFGTAVGLAASVSGADLPAACLWGFLAHIATWTWGTES